jgi:hypothetical protein
MHKQLVTQSTKAATRTAAAAAVDTIRFTLVNLVSSFNELTLRTIRASGSQTD